MNLDDRHKYDWFTRWLHKCQMCQRPGADWYRQNTAYVDYDSNLVRICNFCRNDNDMYWEELWSCVHEGMYSNLKIKPIKRNVLQNIIASLGLEK